MGAAKKALAKARLYLVLDAQVCDYPELFEILKKAAKAKVDVIQFRDKIGSSRKLLEFARRAKKYLKGQVPFIVNDRVDVALASGADGVHLGQEDLPVHEARRVMGSSAIIGRSCQSLSHARQAEKEGADYIGFGSIFKTLTKPGRRPMDLKVLQKVLQMTGIPVFAIGGITLENIGRLNALGVKRIAVTREICLSDDVAKTVKRLRAYL